MYKQDRSVSSYDNISFGTSRQVLEYNYAVKTKIKRLISFGGQCLIIALSLNVNSIISAFNYKHLRFVLKLGDDWAE